ncbi:hypothetical protein C1645_827317 [Glomus cerebriforme]|uniref:Uncharacterized protein n=1 Tax=Glomus cerebriforme TaxID=658196 RepID=A0A397SP02_9GLOM|nr:hypothetical protein C1645_827317 [Glomus cerebriforme]
MTSQNPLAITPRAFKFMTNLFEFPFMNAHTFFAEKSLQPNIKAGFSQFLKCLKLYQKEFDISIAQDDNVTIYGSVTLENGAIIRICYGQILLIVKINIKEQNTLNLVLIQCHKRYYTYYTMF